VLVAGVYNLVLNELNSNKSIWNYIKAYAWAQWSKELALLDIKENGYAYYKKINHDINDESIIFSDNPLDTTEFNNNRDILISYDIWSKVNNYTWELQALWYDIIPLFYTDDNWEYKVKDIDLTILSWSESDLTWNIIWKDTWISWNNLNSDWIQKTHSLNWFEYKQKNMRDFLNNSDLNYLVLFNSSKTNYLKYNIKSINSSEYFSKPKTTIISTAQIWKYKQTISTKLDNTRFLDMLKYSIYSN